MKENLTQDLKELKKKIRFSFDVREFDIQDRYELIDSEAPELSLSVGNFIHSHPKGYLLAVKLARMSDPDFVKNCRKWGLKLDKLVDRAHNVFAAEMKL